MFPGTSCASGYPTKPTARRAKEGAALLLRRVWSRPSLFTKQEERGEKPGGAKQERRRPGPLAVPVPGPRPPERVTEPAQGGPRIHPQPERLVTPGVQIAKGKGGGAWHVLRVPGPEASRLSLRHEAPSPGQNLTRAPILVQCELALVAESGGTDRLRERQKRAGSAGPESTPTSACILTAPSVAITTDPRPPAPRSPGTHGPLARALGESAPTLVASDPGYLALPPPPRCCQAQRRGAPSRRQVGKPSRPGDLTAELIKHLNQGLGCSRAPRRLAPAEVPRTCPIRGFRARAAASRRRCPAPRVQSSRGAGHPRRRQHAGGGEAGGGQGARGGRGARGRRRRWRGRREREQGGRRGGRREARK